MAAPPSLSSCQWRGAHYDTAHHAREEASPPPSPPPHLAPVGVGAIGSLMLLRAVGRVPWKYLVPHVAAITLIAIEQWALIV